MLSSASIIHFLSILLPFTNEIAIVLSSSKLPFFHKLYSPCFEESILGNINVHYTLKKRICSKQDYINKIIIDLIAYFGIILFIGKNTLLYGFATGVATGLVLIFCSIMIPSLFLNLAIHKITKFYKIKNPYLFILIGLFFIFLLIIFTAILEYLTQQITKKIKIDPINEENNLIK